MNIRLIARFVGFIDMIVTIIGTTALVLVCAVMVGGGTESLVSKDKTTDRVSGISRSEKSDISEEAFIGIMSVAIIIAFAIGLLQMYASWKLINGTKKDIIPFYGLSCCLTWRNLTILFLVVQMLYTLKVAAGIGTVSQIMPNIILIVFHVVGILFVNQYMNKLEGVKYVPPPTIVRDAVSSRAQPVVTKNNIKI